ncbi:ABC transporter ATP-binding protein [Campylobacter jejuni]|uniref:ABC transporter ATP-binding protein n=1 Tax=Campylobacter jejuni TaxID=197 RepID=UPI0025815B58|nr:ABC transporter ATP-binding protein [Campylobacter jejuni]GML86510.1 ABC transporter ATP-binding protein [Campylobacter jejuni]HDV6412914.1 ABC transporter ATP-binding protein [Campylobacter jejuni]
MLKLENFSVHRKDLCVVNQINLSLQRGKIYAILGANGAGKSSLLGAIFGEFVSSGQLKFDDKDLSKKLIGYMPQDNYIEASLTALEVVLLGLGNQLGMYLSDMQIKKAAKIMEELSILHLAQSDISTLSGGQRQMVNFASVLLKEPQILLLDEPVSALDLHHQCVLLENVKKHTKEQNLLTLVILHDLSLASQFADELIILHEAKIKAKDKPENVLNKDLIKEVYRIDADIFYCERGLPCVLAKSAVKLKRKENENFN